MYNISILHFDSAYYVICFALHTFGYIFIVFNIWELDSDAMPWV